MKEISYCLWAFCFFLALHSTVQPITPKKIQQTEDSIRAIVYDYQLPGLALAIVSRSSVVWQQGFGHANVEGIKPVTVQTMFRIGSVTKSFVALGILRLVEEGKLNLNDKIADLAPEVQIDNSWSANDPMRLVHLLEHTAGLDDMRFNEFYVPDEQSLSSLEAINQFPNSKVVRWRPGTMTSYANPGYGIAGYILEKFAGIPYEQYIRQEILEPLGMENTGFRRKDIPTEKLALGYAKQEDSLVRVDYQPIRYRWAGEMHASVEDLATFTRMLLNNGQLKEQQILDPAGIHRMETPTSSWAGQAGMPGGYALANTISTEGKAVQYGHGGGIEGFTARYAYYPETGLGYVLLMNTIDAEAFRKATEQLIDLLPEAGDENLPESVVLDKKSVQPYLSTYKIANPRNQLFEGPQKLLNFVQLKLIDDTLLYQPFQGESQALIPLSDSLYRMEDYRRAHILLTTNQAGDPILVDADSLGPVYRQTSGFWHQALLYSFIFSMLLLVSAVPAGLVRLIRQLMGVRKQGRSRIYFLYSSAVIALLLTIVAISSISYENLYNLGKISLLSLSIFILPLLFFLLGVVAVYFSVQKIKNAGALLSSYLVLLSIAFAEISFVLWDWHLLGLMIWRW